MAKTKRIAKPKEEKAKIEKVEKEKASDIFTFIKWLTTDKKKWEELTPVDQKAVQPFIVNMFLGMDMYWTGFINELAEVSQGMDKEMWWRLYYEMLPAQRPSINFVKAKKIEGVDEKVIECFVKYFECTEVEAVEYINLLMKKGLQEEIKKIKTNYIHE